MGGGGVNEASAVNAGSGAVDEHVLLKHLRQAMRFNIDAQCYTDAIFYADKIVNLVNQSGTIPSRNNAAAAAGNMSEHSKSSISEATQQAVYDLGK